MLRAQVVFFSPSFLVSILCAFGRDIADAVLLAGHCRSPFTNFFVPRSAAGDDYDRRSWMKIALHLQVTRL